eukprot:788779-Amphidinium_carterae.1
MIIDEYFQKFSNDDRIKEIPCLPEEVLDIFEEGGLDPDYIDPEDRRGTIQAFKQSARRKLVDRPRDAQLLLGPSGASCFPKALRRCLQSLPDRRGQL